MNLYDDLAKTFQEKERTEIENQVERSLQEQISRYKSNPKVFTKKNANSTFLGLYDCILNILPLRKKTQRRKL